MNVDLEDIRAMAARHPGFTYSKDVLSYDDVSRLVDADFDTGKLYWRHRTPDMFKPGKRAAEHSCKNWNSKNAGKEAFSLDSSGYKRGRINGQECVAHRVIWLLHTGEWPEGEIDHINGVRSDNRLCNLRDVSRKENRKNTKLQNNNKSGVPGVFQRSESKWIAYIKTNGKRRHLGSFHTFEEAVASRQTAAAALGFHANHGRA